MPLRIIRSTCLFIAGLCIMGCEADTDAIIERMIAERIEKRLDEFLHKEKERCLDQIMVEAALAADSALRANPISIMLDSLDRPPVPSKPSRPPLELPRDSVSIAPIVPTIELQE